MIYWLIGLTIAWVFLFWRINKLSKALSTQTMIQQKEHTANLNRILNLPNTHGDYVTKRQLAKVITRYNDKYESQFNDIHHALNKKVDKYRFYAAPPSDNLKYRVMPATITADDFQDLPEVHDYVSQIMLTNKWEAWYRENRPKV